MGSFSIYPNPNKGNFVIELNSLESDLSSLNIDIVNLLGQVVYSKISETSSRIEIKTELLKQGVYRVILYQVDKVIGQSKLVIE